MANTNPPITAIWPEIATTPMTPPPQLTTSGRSALIATGSTVVVSVGAIIYNTDIKAYERLDESNTWVPLIPEATFPLDLQELVMKPRLGYPPELNFLLQLAEANS